LDPELVAVNTVPLVTELPHVNPEELIEHSPLDVVSVNPEPDVVAV